MLFILQFGMAAFFLIRRMRSLFGWRVGCRSWFRSGDRLRNTSYGRSGTSGRREGVLQKDGISFIIQQEHFYHGMLKQLGLVQELQLGDLDFDKQYYIVTDYPDVLEKANQSGELLALLKSLFALPVTSLEASRTRIWCEIEGEDLGQKDPYFDQHAELMRQIAALLKSQALQTRQGSRVSRRSMAFIAMGIHAGLFAASIWWIAPLISDAEQVWDRGIIFAWMAGGALLAVGLWWSLLVRLFRGTSWGGMVFADFIIWGVAGFLLSVSLLIHQTNIHLPQGAASMTNAPVVLRKCTLRCGNGRSSDKYPIALNQCTAETRAATAALYHQQHQNCRINNNWFFDIQTSPLLGWTTRGNYKFRSWDAEFFDKATLGTQLSIPVQPGALGARWIDANNIGFLMKSRDNRRAVAYRLDAD